MSSPHIVIIAKGKIHLIYAIWCIRSLLKFKYQQILLIVANPTEKNFAREKLPGVHCEIMSAEMGDYPAFSYKPFVIQKCLEAGYFEKLAEEIVICDADILWKKDPHEFFKRFERKNWVHKITALNPNDYLEKLENVSPINIGLVTNLNYLKVKKIEKYPNFRVNAGLFKLPKSRFSEVIADWMDKITSLSFSEMQMSEALLSLTYAELNLTPVCDRTDIKHLGVEQNKCSLPVAEFEVSDPGPNEFSGYDTAKHYFGDQRAAMHDDARRLGFDHDHLLPQVKKALLEKKLKKGVQKLKKLVMS